MDMDRLKGSAKELGGKIEEAAGHVTGDDEARASGVARQIEGKGQNLYGQAKDGLRDSADLAGQAYDEISRHVTRNAREAGEKVGGYPLTSLLLAGAVGYLAGVLFRRA